MPPGGKPTTRRAGRAGTGGGDSWRARLRRGDADHEAESGNDVVRGGGGNDRVAGGSDNDVVYGGAGDDSLFGGVGSDVVYGGAGNDTLHALAADGQRDVLACGPGTDTALIRIHPRRILSFGIEEPPGEPHQTRLRTRDLP